MGNKLLITPRTIMDKGTFFNFVYFSSSSTNYQQYYFNTQDISKVFGLEMCLMTII